MKTILGLAVLGALAFGGYRYWKSAQAAPDEVAAEAPEKSPERKDGPEVGRVRSMTGEVD